MSLKLSGATETLSQTHTPTYTSFHSLMLPVTALEGMLVLHALELRPPCGLTFGTEEDTWGALSWLTGDVNTICLCRQSTCHSQHHWEWRL